MINAIKSLAAFTWRSRMKNAGVVVFAVIALIPAIISFIAIEYAAEHGFAEVGQQTSHDIEVSLMRKSAR